MNNPFDGMAALVTGGSSGIGLATVRALRHQGVRVASLDLKPGPADEDGVLALAADVSETASVHAAVEEAMERLGRLDVLVNNAEPAPRALWRITPRMSGVGCSRSMFSALSG